MWLKYRSLLVKKKKMLCVKRTTMNVIIINKTRYKSLKDKNLHF